MINHLREIIRYRDLLWIWTRRELKIRYKQSFLGAAWAILQPLSMALIFTVVFSVLVKLPTDDIPYPLFSYTALLPWTFFTTAITLGAPSLVNNMNLVTKIYFPREILPLSVVGASLVDFAVASIVFVGMLLLYYWPLRITVLLVPLILLVQILLTLGIVFFAAAINVFYRDVRFVIPLALQLWLYATPIVYPLSSVPEWVRPYYMLNPMAVLIDSYRRLLLLGQMPDWPHLAEGSAIALAIFLGGYLYFKHAERDFADLI